MLLTLNVNMLYFIQRGHQEMTFGDRIRELRKAKDLSQRDLAQMVGVNFTYLSKVENSKLDFAQFPSEELIRKLAKALQADEDELLLLAQKIPDAIKQRVIKRPDVFRKMASLDDSSLDNLDKAIDDMLRRMDQCDEDTPKS